jgi:hypothetical protein
MSQNHHIPASNCAAFAPLLPLAAHHLLSDTADARLRAHLAGCAHCRSVLTDYDVIEEALRRSFAPRLGASPPFTREELLQTLDRHTDDRREQPAPAAPPIAPAAPRWMRRRYLAGLPAVAALLVVVLIIATLFATHAGHAPGSGKTTTVASLTVVGSDTELHDISMVSPTEGWAVGFAIPADDPNNTPTAVLMHYTRGVWTRVQTAIHERVSSVSMVSATDGWAVGEDGLVLHFDGKTWKQTASIASPLERVQMVSATDGWAIGDGIWHYNGHNWTAQPLPASLNLGFGPQQNDLYLLGLSMLSASDGWAVGYLTYPSTEIYPTIPPGGVILHYTGGHWIVDTIIKGASLQSISMTSASDGWVAGRTDTYVPLTVNNGGPGSLDKTTGLLLHDTGGTWTRIANPLATPSGKYDGDLLDVALDSSGSGWLIGASLTDAPGLLRYDGAQWTPVSLPASSAFKDDTRFYTIVNIAIVSPAEAWAVGYKFSTAADGIPSNSSGGYQPTITPVMLHYQHGAWSVYPS